MNGAPLEPLVQHLGRLVEARATRELSDAQLLEQFARGHDEAAFATLMRRHGRLVWHVCRQVLHQEQDAEDAFQASFLVLALKAASLRPGQGLGNWLHGVAYRVAMNARRKTTRRQAHERRKAATAPRALPSADALHELQTLLHQEIHHLPAKYRVTLVLCGLEGKSKSEAARELGWKEGTVSGRLARARTMLAARLARRGVLLSAAWAATTLGADAGAAVIPSPLVDATAAAALHLSAGKAPTAAIVSRPVAALMKGALRAASLTKLKRALTFVLGLALLGAGASMAAYEAFTSQPTPFGRALPARAGDEKPAPQAKPPRVDRFGDPLPEGAIARLGTVRLYHRDPIQLPYYSPVSCLLYSPDGKMVISAGWTETIRFWDVASGKEVRRFVVPQSDMPAGEWNVVVSLALSSDGKTLAAGTRHGPLVASTGGWPPRHQGFLYLWDVASGKLLHQCQGEEGSSVAFSPNNKVLASFGGPPSRVRLWEVSTGKELRRFPVDVHCTSRVAFSPRSDTLAVHGDATIFIMDAATGKALHKLQGHVNVIIGVAFSRDGKTLASIEAGRDERDPHFYVRLWDVASGKLLRRLGHASWVSAVAFGTDGMLAALAHDGIHFWDSHSGKELRHTSGPRASSSASSSLAFSPDGKTVAYGNGDGVISFWDVATATQVQRMPRHQGRLRSLAVSPDGRTVATASDDRSIGLWDVASARQLRTLRGHKDPVQFVAFSPNGKLLASASFDDNAARSGDNIFLWDLATGEIVQRLKGRCLAFSPDGKQLACGGFDDEVPRRAWPGIIRLHDVETGKRIRRFQGHKAGVQAIAFSPDGKTLASASSGAKLLIADAPQEDFTLRLWDVASGRERCQVDRSNFNPSILTFSPDGRLLITRGERFTSSNQLRIWEVATGQRRRVLDLKKSESVTSVLFLSDGRTLAIGNSRDEIGFCDLATAREWGRIRGHYGTVNCLALSPDARTLFSGSADTTALVWDLASDFTPPRPDVAPLPGGGVETLWADLASTDAAQADRAIWTLVRAGNEAANYLAARLRPATDDPEKRIPQLLTDLDSKSFATREAASKELEQLLPEADERLRKARHTHPSAEVRRRLADLLERNPGMVTAPEVLRRIRAVEVLEHIATPEARALLTKLAAGAPGARLTQEAKAAVQRLVKRATARP